MGITQADVPDWSEHGESARQYYHLTPPAEACCARCLELVTHPCIYWALPCVIGFGEDADASATIYLHKACAVSFSRALLQDAERMDRLEALARRLKGAES